MKWLRVPFSQQTVDLHVSDEVTDDFDLLHGIVRKFGAGNSSSISMSKSS